MLEKEGAWKIEWRGRNWQAAGHFQGPDTDIFKGERAHKCRVLGGNKATTEIHASVYF